MSNTITNGDINFNHALQLTFTMVSAGNTEPVGVIKYMMPMPNKQELTTSLPGIFNKMASAPMMGMVSTAIPDDELTGMVKKK